MELRIFVPEGHLDEYDLEGFEYTFDDGGYVINLRDYNEFENFQGVVPMRFWRFIEPSDLDEFELIELLEHYPYQFFEADEIRVVKNIYELVDDFIFHNVNDYIIRGVLEKAIQEGCVEIEEFLPKALDWHYKREVSNYEHSPSDNKKVYVFFD